YPCSCCGAEYGGACDPGCEGSRRCVCKNPGINCVRDCPVRILDEQSGQSKSNGTPRKNTRTIGDGERYRGGKAHTTRGFYDSGGASRFFYVPKPSPRERDHGCEHLPAKTGGEATDREEGSAGLKNPRAGAGRGGGRRNTHPTVKSIALMRWLCRLI